MKKIFSLFAAVLFCTSMFAATYTVAGDSKILGSHWDKDDATNTMTLVEGIYQLVKENVTLGAGNYEYKVVKDHDWDAWKSENSKLVIAEDGIYDITFTFVEEGTKVGANATKKGSAVVEKHYLVAGVATVANGKNWDEKATENLMTTADGGLTYTLTIENVELFKGNSYEYKIVEQGTWQTYYPEKDNASFSVEETAIYTIQYVYTVATSTCEVKTTKTGGSDAVPAIKMHGDFSGSWNDTEAFAIATDKKTASLVLTLEAKSYTFGLRIGGDNNWTANGASFSRANASAVVVAGSGNLTLAADVAGDYTFVWTYETNTLAITFPEKGEEQTLEDGYYLNGSHVEWKIADLAPYKFVVNPGNPEEYMLENVTLTLNQELKVCYVKDGVVADDNWYGVGEGNGNFVVTEAYVGVKTIYFTPVKSEAWGGYMYIEPNQETAISNTTVEGKAVKSIVNGMLVIEKAGVRYNVMGQIVK